MKLPHGLERFARTNKDCATPSWSLTYGVVAEPRSDRNPTFGESFIPHRSILSRCHRHRLHGDIHFTWLLSRSARSSPFLLLHIMTSIAAAKRLRKELQVLSKQPPDSDICLAVHPNNLLTWKAWIVGPAHTPYKGGVFELDIKCGTEYPLAPPSIKFVTKVRYI